VSLAAPDYFEPVVGWRAWYAVEGGGAVHLMSLFHPTPWPQGEPFAATCRAWKPFWRRRSNGHEPPHDGCGCGIYASSLEAAGRYVPSHVQRARWPVLGTVSLWGSLDECERGWRASLAYPRRLYVPAVRMRRARVRSRIAAGLQEYGVPIEVVDAWKPDEVLQAIASMPAIEYQRLIA